MIVESILEGGGLGGNSVVRFEVQVEKMGEVVTHLQSQQSESRGRTA